MSRERRGEPDLPPGPARELVDMFRRLRRARNLTGGQLAVKTGLSPSYISDVLRGWRSPSADTAMKIVNALGGSLEEITGASRLAEELTELNRFSRRRQSGPAASSKRRPAVLDYSEVSLYQVNGLADQPERFLGIVTGDIRRVRCAEAWVNPENTEMVMARFSEFSVSSIIRYEGAVRDEAGKVTGDLVADELARKVADRAPVQPGIAILTGSGELARLGVRYIVHVAAVRGEPGAGFEQIREIGRCVTSALAEVDKTGAVPPVSSILFPLLGTGQGGGDLDTTVSSLAGSAIDYFAAVPGSPVTKVYFLAYTDAELAALESLFTVSKRLTQVPSAVFPVPGGLHDELR
jgi:transcriptional regulator with XRE-family HTH domain